MPTLPQNTGDGILDPHNLDAFKENGRLYFNSRSLFPYDEHERDRLDVFHKFFLGALLALHETPIDEDHKTRVLDVGTGTGIWAIEMAKQYPNLRVVGIDQARMQPAGNLTNCVFNYFDIEGPWNIVEPPEWGPGRDFDLAYVRMMAGSIVDWPGLYRKIYRSLRPGGRIEHLEVDWDIGADGNSMPEDATLRQWSDLFKDAMASAGYPVNVSSEARKAWLRNAGFVDIQDKYVKIGCNPWQLEPGPRVASRWLNLGLVCGAEALSMAPFTRHMGKTKEEVDAMVIKFHREVCTLRIRSYLKLWVWTARRPDNS